MTVRVGGPATFVRDDGVELRVVDGFRERLLRSPRTSVQPKPEWTDADYQSAAEKKVRQADALVAAYRRLGGAVDGARALELGCGAGIDCILLARHGFESVVGIDIALPVFEPGPRGERTRRLAREVLRVAGLPADIEAAFDSLPVRLEQMDATRTSFPDGSFDLLWSRAALEHIVPPEPSFAEMTRIVRPGGLLHHTIDPFFWLKGCHKGGVVDIPWAHARLTASELRRYVAEAEGSTRADRVSRHLRTLNQLTVRDWRAVVDRSPFEVLDWRLDRWTPAAALLEEHPEVPDTVLDGVEPVDLTVRSIKVWLRKPLAQ